MPSEKEGKTANKIVPRNCHVGELNEIVTKIKPHSHLQVGKLASHLELDTAAMSHLQLAKAQLRVTHGTNHPIYSRSLTALIAELELIMKLDPRSLRPQAAIQST